MSAARSPLMWLALVLVWSAGCGPQPEASKSFPPPATLPPVGPVHAPFDVGAVVRQAQRDPRVSAEMQLTEPVAQPVIQEQFHPAVAFDGTNYLVVWQDNRNALNPTIFGARVSPDGTLLDKNAFPISQAINRDQYAPAIVFDGTHYFVVWSETLTGDPRQIYGARVKPDGTVLDPSGLRIDSGSAFKNNVAIAYDGTQYLVVWQQRESTADYTIIHGTRVTPDGTVLDPGGRQLSLRHLSPAYHRVNPAVSFDGTQFLVVWDQEPGPIFGTRVARDGTVLDPEEITFPSVGSAQAPAVASDGTQSLVVWGDGDIQGARIRPDGTLVDTAAFTISSAANTQQTPAITFDGTSYWVTWSDARVSTASAIYAAQVQPDGTVVHPQGVPVCSAPTLQSQPAVINGAGQWFAAWTYGYSSLRNIHGARITLTGTVLDPNGQAVSMTTTSQNNFAIAYDGTQYLVVWDEERYGNAQDIFGVRVKPDGTVLDPQPIAISTGGGQQQFPEVVFDGTQFVVVWEDSRASGYAIYRARVSRDGRVLDPNGVVTSGAKASRPAVASDGTQTFVVWVQSMSTTGSDIYGLRLTPAGQSLDGQGKPISQAPLNQFQPNVTFTGSHFLVVWEDLRTDGGHKIYGARVKPDFTRLDGNGFRISPSWGEDPSLATDGQNTLVVWNTFQGSTRYNIQGARISPGGQVLEPTGILITQGVADELLPTVSFDGTHYQVVWNQTHTSTVPNPSDIYGTRVTPEGTVLEPGGVALSEGAEDEIAPVIGTHGAGASLVVYGHWSPLLGSYRARARFLAPPGVDAACTRDEALPHASERGTGPGCRGHAGAPAHLNGENRPMAQ